MIKRKLYLYALLKLTFLGECSYASQVDVQSAPVEDNPGITPFLGLKRPHAQVSKESEPRAGIEGLNDIPLTNEELMVVEERLSINAPQSKINEFSSYKQKLKQGQEKQSKFKPFPVEVNRLSFTASEEEQKGSRRWVRSFPEIKGMNVNEWHIGASEAVRILKRNILKPDTVNVALARIVYKLTNSEDCVEMPLEHFFVSGRPSNDNFEQAKSIVRK